MSWTERLRAWWSGGQQVDAPAGAEEIDEELLFHLRSLVEDNLKRGMPDDTAWQEAQKRFGSLRRYADACRDRSVGRWAMRLVPVAALFVVGVLCGRLLLDVGARQEPVRIAGVEQNRQIVETMAVAKAEAMLSDRQQNQSPRFVHRSVELHDLTGQVVDPCGKPLANATLLVILKTWPGGMYSQEPFAATSDAEGRFSLPKLIPDEGQFAVQVEAFRPGYALASSYQLQPGRGPNRFEPVTLRLTEASPITLVVQDCNGRSVARARVVPAARRSPDGARHLVYFQGSEAIQTAADEAGRVGVDWFATGDRAKILVQLPGKDWELHEIYIPTGERTITVSARSAVDEDDDSSADPTVQSPS